MTLFSKFRLHAHRLLFTALLLLPAPVFAHVGSGNAGGFLTGMQHPISGFDHVLATGCLHGLGIGIGLIHRWKTGRLVLRGAGALVFAAGLYFLWGALV